MTGAAARSVARDVAALADRYELQSPARDQLLTLLALVADDPRAPTAVRDPRAVVDDHLADSLIALELSVVRTATAVADIGSGAGFPGLPLAIARPQATVALVDGAGRKCAFIRSAIAACAAANASAIHARAETWDDGFGRCDLVTARAVAPLAVLAEYAAPLLRVGGSLVAWRGRRDPDVEAAGARAASELGLEVGEVVAVKPYPAAENRHLHVITKVAETPSRFPRRPGLARKRPLGS